jgi:hypothetical protein
VADDLGVGWILFESRYERLTIAHAMSFARAPRPLDAEPQPGQGALAPGAGAAAVVPIRDEFDLSTTSAIAVIP